MTRLLLARDKQEIVVDEQLAPFVSFLRLLRNHAIFHDLSQFLLAECHDRILRFQVRMNNLANPMQVVQSNEHLLRHAPHQGHRNPAVIVSLHYLQQVDPQYLEHHDKVISVGPVMHERVQQLHHLRVLTRELPVHFLYVLLGVPVVVFQRRQPLRILDVLGYNIQDLDLVVGGHFVARCALLDLERDERVLVLHVFGEPHG